MKKVKILLASFLILNCICLQAQSKWYVAPLVGVTTMDEKFGFNANLTLGRYLSDFGKGGRFRADISAGYFGFSENNVYSAAAIFTATDDGTRKFCNSVSMGFGVQKSENRSKYDFIIPIRASYGFIRVNNNIWLGPDMTANLNLSDFLHRTTITLGFFIGIGM